MPRDTRHPRWPSPARYLLPACVLCALLATVGCFKLARPTPPLEEYVLGGAANTVTAAPARNSGGDVLTAHPTRRSR